MAAALKINAAFLWEDCLELQISCSFIFVENISFIEEWAEARLTKKKKKYWKCNDLVRKLTFFSFKEWFTGRAVMLDMFSVKIAYVQYNQFISHER